MAKGIYAGVTKTLGDYAEGDIIQLNESGSPVDFYVAKHNYESGLNGAGRTLLVRKEVYDERQWHSSDVNAYATSTIDSWLNSTYKNLLDGDVRTAMGTTKFPYTPGNGTTSVSELARSVFLLSNTELGLEYGYDNTEGTELPNSEYLQIAKQGDTAKTHWTRTPRIYGVSSSFYFDSDGNVQFCNCSVSHGSRPAFTLPSSYTIPDKARKVKKMYVGVDSLARKVKKAYIGVGGVARPCYTGGELAYYGTATPLSIKGYRMAATTVGNYALFGGRYSNPNLNEYNAAVDVYDTALVRTTATPFSYGQGFRSATTVEGYALFGGGRSSVNGMLVDAYDTSLVRTAPASLHIAKAWVAAGTVGNHAIFAGGSDNNESYTYTKVAEAYDASLTKTTIASLSVVRYNIDVPTVGNYVLFAGGYMDHVTSVDAYNASLTRTTAPELDIGRNGNGAATVGNYALIGGGLGYTTYAPSVNAYDASLTKTMAPQLSYSVTNLSATAIGEFALFGGGNGTISVSESGHSDTVDVYDVSLTKTTTTPLSEARTLLAAVTIGNYALFAGGQGQDSGGSTVVDVYTIS